MYLGLCSCIKINVSKYTHATNGPLTKHSLTACLHPRRSYCSINFLYGWPASTASWSTARHIRHTAITSTASCLINFHHDRIDNALKLFLLSFKFVFFSKLVFVQPIQGFLHGLLNLFFIVTLKLVLELFLRQGVTHREAVVLQAVFGLNLGFVLLIFSAVLLRFLHHTINLSLGQASFFIGDSDLIGLARGFVLGRHVKNAISINIKSHFDLWDTTRRWGNTIQMKFTQHVVVFCHSTLPLEDLNQYSWLIVSVRSKSLTFLSWDCRVALDELGHHASSGL